jgi:transposase
MQRIICTIEYILYSKEMKLDKKILALEKRRLGHSIRDIAKMLEVSKSSVSLWVREVKLTEAQSEGLSSKPFTSQAANKRRETRLSNEESKRRKIIDSAKFEIKNLDLETLKIVGAMLYWAEGGKTQRMARFSNGDPEMITLMMKFFREVCGVEESKFRGYIHIYETLDHTKAEKYWSSISSIPLRQFFKTYRKPNVSSKGLKITLPYGVFDVYVLDVQVFYKIQGWIEAAKSWTA